MNELYIQNTLCSLKELEIAKENIEKQIKEHEKVVKEYMQINGIEELYGVNGEILGRRFDTKEFKKHFADLYYSYMKDTRNLRFKFSY